MGLILSKGQVVTGRWEMNSYVIERLLGSGGTGSVYLARGRDNRKVALKVSTDLFAICHEHRVMVFLNRCKNIAGLNVLPRVFELDDFQVGDAVCHYLVIEYVEGQCLGPYLGRMQEADIAAAGARILRFLQYLHQEGFIYGDIKPGNILFDYKNKKLCIIDFGSVVNKGSRINQYTPSYERGSWQAGSRVADEHYDLFALGVLMASLLTGSAARVRGAGLPGLVRRVAGKKCSLFLKEAVISMLQQEDRQWDVMAEELEAVSRRSESAGSVDETGFFVNIVGMASAASFVLGLIYYWR